MRTTSVKPHILSWLQRAPAAHGKLIELAPRLASSKVKRADSVLITRSCLGSTTASGLLGMHRKPALAWGAKLRFVAQVAAALGLVFLLAPGKTPAIKVASQPVPPPRPPLVKGLPGFSAVTVRN